FFGRRGRMEALPALSKQTTCRTVLGSIPERAVMNQGISIVSVLKRDRTVVVAGLVAISALAWGYMVHEARAMVDTGGCRCAGMRMSGPDTQSWSATTLVPLFLMWTEMMVAMMKPSAAPMILTFAAVNRKRLEREQPFVPTGIFLLGYLVVWTLF